MTGSVFSGLLACGFVLAVAAPSQAAGPDAAWFDATLKHCVKDRGPLGKVVSFTRFGKDGGDVVWHVRLKKTAPGKKGIRAIRGVLVFGGKRAACEVYPLYSTGPGLAANNTFESVGKWLGDGKPSRLLGAPQAGCDPDDPDGGGCSYAVVVRGHKGGLAAAGRIPQCVMGPALEVEALFGKRHDVGVYDCHSMMGGEALFARRNVLGVVGKRVKLLLTVYQGVQFTEHDGKNVCVTGMNSTFETKKRGPAPVIEAFVPVAEGNGPKGKRITYAWDAGKGKFVEARSVSESRPIPKPVCKVPPSEHR